MRWPWQRHRAAVEAAVVAVQASQEEADRALSESRVRAQEDAEAGAWLRRIRVDNHFTAWMFIDALGGRRQ